MQGPSEMKTRYVYCFITPFDEKFRDDAPPLGTVPIELKAGRILEAAILGTQNTVKAVRLAFPDVENKTFELEDRKLFDRFQKLMLDAIRLAYDPCAEYFRAGENLCYVYTFEESGAPPSLDMRLVQQINPEYRVNVEAIRQLFAAPKVLRPVLHLFADSGDVRAPVQFRFLSLYKILEMHYGEIRPKKKVNVFLKPRLAMFRTEYPDVTTPEAACVVLRDLRNRCAHIIVGRGDLGFSHFETPPDEVVKAMPIIRYLAIQCVRLHYPDAPLQFAFSPEDLAEQIAEMERRGQQPKRRF
jgi:hypothetical protein